MTSQHGEIRQASPTFTVTVYHRLWVSNSMMIEICHWTLSVQTDLWFPLTSQHLQHCEISKTTPAPAPHCTMGRDPMIQDLRIITSNHIPCRMSPNPDEPLDWGSGGSRLILGFPESGEAPKGASEKGQGEARFEAISRYFIFFFVTLFCHISHFVLSTAPPVKVTTSKTNLNTDSAAYLGSIRRLIF